jgi:hypothetical protein
LLLKTLLYTPFTTGLKNLKALSDVSLHQTLNYVFPFNNLEFQTDISLLIVSNGKSLVPVSVAYFGGKNVWMSQREHSTTCCVDLGGLCDNAEA